MKPRSSVASGQQGLVMVIALIMLLAVTLMVVTAANLVQANLKVVQNMESRELARAAALAAIEEAISDLRFTTSPDAMFSANSGGCINVQGQGAVVGKCVSDYNGDGQEDVTVSMEEPTCVAVTPRRNNDLDVFNSLQQASCYLPPDVYSMCGDAVFEFRATATDDVTGTSVFIRQGVSVLTALNNTSTICPI